MKRIAAVLFVLLLVAAGGAFVLYTNVKTPYRGYDTSEALVDIPPGLSTTGIGRRLTEAGVVRDLLTYRAELWWSGAARRLQAGPYRFDRPMTPGEVIEKIARGDVDRVRVTFPEGLTIAEMSRVFESTGMGTAADFVASARDVSLIDAIDPGARDLEGYLFPDTYAVPRRAEASELVRMMVDRFTKVLTDDLRAGASAHGWTVHQLVTLASIVEKESASPEERPLVAAVYINRLRIKMGLQCDPTVIYALDRAGKYTGNLRRDDLAFDSPYNTYRYPGLPPGPIAAPGRTSLEAVVHPAEADYLYFVSRNDGSHEFARTLAEHNRNVQKYQVQYFRRKRAGKIRN